MIKILNKKKEKKKNHFFMNKEIYIYILTEK